MGKSDSLIAGVYPLRRVGYVAVSAVAATVALYACVVLLEKPTMFALIYLLALGIAGISVVVWLWRARTNLNAFPDVTCSLGAGWAIGGWFVPLANLVIPFRVMDDVTRGSMPKSAVAKVVPLWWTTFLLSGLLGVIAVRGTIVPVLVVLLYAVAGASLSYLMVVVGRAQEAEIKRRRAKMETA